MKIKFLGAAKTVTGSFHVLETDNVRFAVDCGLFQGSSSIKERNYQPFRIDPTTIDFMILTHAHIDHSGLVPKLCANGFKGPIYCSQATLELSEILLPDSAHIQESEIERKNRKLGRAGKPLLRPIYSVEDAQKSLKQFKSLPYDQSFSPAPGIEVKMRDAGHILGSAILEIWITEGEKTTKMVFSGDLGNYGQNIINDPTFIEEADYLLVESTYGNRLHESNSTRIQQLQEAIDFTMKKSGNLVIPAFAVERTQDLLYDLSVLRKQGKLPDVDVVIDSPLAVSATEIFERHPEFYDRETRDLINQGVNPFHLPGLKFSRTKEESMALNQLGDRAIIISASGMCDAGRIKHHLKHNLWRPESTVLFVGYQAQGTLGRRLLEGEKLVNIHGESIGVKADIRQIDGYSAHADQAGILLWLKHFKTLPKMTFLVHGEEESAIALQALIEKELKIPVHIPGWLDEVDIDPAAEAIRLETSPALEIAPVALGTDATKAMQAEQAYLEFRLLANQFFQQNWDAKDYDQIISNLQTAKNLLKS